MDCGLVFGCFDPKDGIFGNSNVLDLKNAKNGNIGCFVTLKLIEDQRKCYTYKKSYIKWTVVWYFFEIRFLET